MGGAEFLNINYSEDYTKIQATMKSDNSFMMYYYR